MPTKKIEPTQPPEWNKLNKKNACFSPDHNPPTHIVLSPGNYEHTCSDCGRVVYFSVPSLFA